MRFWDASALVPLCYREESSTGLLSLLQEDKDLVVWWATRVECESAFSRLQRNSNRGFSGLEASRSRLSVIAESWSEIEASDRLRLEAIRLLKAHPLRAADALQLAAALAWVADRKAARDFVCLDRRLSEAAAKEGFRVLPQAS